METSRTAKARLLVLDSSKYLKLFDAILGSDYELLVTDDAGEAILMAASQKPDLILLSYSVEKADGIMVAREIRDCGSTDVPILLMLTSDRPTLRREAEKAGCNGFLIKPIDPGKIRSLIGDWLQAKNGQI